MKGLIMAKNNDNLTPFYMKISKDLKIKLQEQAKKERVPMVALITEMLELGLLVRPRMKQDKIEQLLSAAELVHFHGED